MNSGCWSVLSAALVLSVVGSVVSAAGTLDSAQAQGRFEAAHPRAGLYFSGGRVTSVYGPAFSRGATT